MYEFNSIQSIKSAAADDDCRSCRCPAPEEIQRDGYTASGESR